MIVVEISEFDSLDEEPPQVYCPVDMSALTDPAQAFATVNYENPTAEDNSGSEPTVKCEPPTRTQFNVGVNEVTCTATDKAGLEDECTFDIVVEGKLRIKFKYFCTACF